MAEYRRFVAYVYEYQKGKKGNNCGFIKVEAWKKLCRMEIHLRCPGLLAGMECSVYGFVRRKGLLDGSRIGSCRTEEGRMDCLLETETVAAGHGKISLEEMNGMVLVLESGGFFGTEWDDQPIRPEDFRVMPEVKEREELENSVENTDEDDRNAVKQNIVEQSAGEEVTKPQDTDNSQPEIHTQSIEGQEIEEYPRRPPEPLRRPPESSRRPPEPSRRPPEPSRRPPEPPRPPHRPKPVGTPCDAFNDGELTDCRKITPEELCFLGRRACMLRNNRFLQYGYYNFGHLLLCRNTCGQWILGVPGGYDQQEHFMANMFGFSCFKESPNIRIPKGRGGYWYRLIDAPNLDS